MAAGRARVRREILADLLRDLGPASPTLCAGWSAHDLAAHLVTRERVPWAGPGLVVGALRGLTESAERATMRAHNYPELVEMFRGGPPWWHPTRFGPLDDAANLVEFFVHTEDLRRAAPGRVPAVADVPAGADDATLDRDAMWAALRLIGLAEFRHSAVGVVAERTDAPGRLTLRRREPVVEIVGPPEELLLFAFGRYAAAQVELRGTPEAVAAVTARAVAAPAGAGNRETAR
ncbi:TIGR03085 family metal-binding protein [Parafrankia sp. EUN1f]|uniref:TIGR03085 family metal-binding protein n=1 Tax=Parafrankia sp. EUN1f TaxID=102897 RepID=UPI0001C45617|nr:TIGR03085 family metal-binding protein [Parafrankia sp. EUN1f]EFC83669.1 hypothetical protein FrEUN1fDRAFT_3218 [Parafrankia sp. EUN1f]